MIQDFYNMTFYVILYTLVFLIGLVAPLIGVFVVIRRLSLIADALSHVTLSGIAASLLLEKTILQVDFKPLIYGDDFLDWWSATNRKLRTVYKHYQN